MTRARVVPGQRAIAAVAILTAGVAAAIIIGVPAPTAARLAAFAVSILLAVAVWDWFSSLRAWRQAAPTLTRRLPAAFAIGIARSVPLTVVVQGGGTWRCTLHDHADASLLTQGLPAALVAPGGKRVELEYTVTPTRRGDVTFAPAHIRVRSRWGLSERLDRLGAAETRRVYPDFGQVAKYAWLAGDHRLPQMGVKSYRQRGQGTDFKQLSEYRPGESLRHLDWRATLRLDKPIVREFQDERDQCVMLLVDCGRRMRADDRLRGAGATHFDQVLNAVMLLGYVALKQGDAVGAMTFGTPPAARRSFAPRKGIHALSALMGELYAVQPTLTHSDYVAAAQELLRRQHKRALVVVITNFRDEDSVELGHALRLLRSRHLVLLASLHERIIDELVAQPLIGIDAPIEVATAHLYEQSRRDAFNRLAGKTFMVDAEPARLGVDLVNRYHAVKRAGLI